MKQLRNTWVVAKRELASYFTSPLAYIFIIIFLVLAGFFTFNVGSFFDTNSASLGVFFQWHPWLYLFLVPAIGMRSWAEERRSGTIELLLTMPINASQAIIGKFLAAWIVLAVALALTFPMIITVNYLGDPDNGVIISGYLGSFLLAGAYLAISNMTSAMTRNQIVSFIVSVVLCLFILLAGWSPVTSTLVDIAPAWLVNTVRGFSVMPHVSALQRGVIDIQDICYFVSVVVFGLFTAGVVLYSKRV